MGPVFGGTELTLYGLRFRDGKCQVKFSTALAGKSEIIVDAQFIDTQKISVKTPNFENQGAQMVDVKININGQGWTVDKMSFNYFANTNAKNCMAYGPGLLKDVSCLLDMFFFLMNHIRFYVIP